MAQTLGDVRMHLSKLPIGTGVDLQLLSDLINDAIETMCRAHPFGRLSKDGIIETITSYTTGTVSIASGATAGTGTGTTFTAAMTGRRIRVANLKQFYTFTYVSPTSFTIDRAYEPTADAVDAAFTIWQPVFELPAGITELTSFKCISRRNDIMPVSLKWLDENMTDRERYGPPVWYAPIGDSATPLAQIELYPGPIAAEGLMYECKTLPARLTSTSQAIPEWLSIPAIKAYVKAELYGTIRGDLASKQAELQAFQSLLATNGQEDARSKPPHTMLPADRSTVHRARRVYRNFWYGWRQ